MKQPSLLFRNSLLFVASLFFLTILAGPAASQESSGPQNNEPTRAKFPAAKAQANAPADADADAAAEKSVEAQKSPKAEKDSPDAIRKRDEWFYRQRASVNGHIPAGARAQALAHRDRMMEAEGKLLHRPDGSIAEVAAPPVSAAANPVTNAWTSVGPTPTTGGEFSPVTGRITAIAVDPSDTTGNTVLIGGAQGGIWRTTTGGSTWTAVGDQNTSLAMGSIAFAPTGCSALPGSCTVYAGTGEQASIGFDIYYGAGVLKSTDHGQTWASTCVPNSTTCPFVGPFNDASVFGFFSLGGARISYIAVNPTNPLLVLAGVQFALSGNEEGVYCSADGGSTWSNVLPGQMSTFVGFASSTVAFAALGDPFGSNSSGTGTNPNGIYEATVNPTSATPCSMTFTALAGGLPASASMGRIDLGISPNFTTDHTVYASISDATQFSDTNLGVWVTTNGGTSWTQTTAPDVCQQQCWYDNVIKVDPNNSKIVYLGGAAVTDSSGNPAWLIRSTDGGNTWVSVLPTSLGPSLLHVDQHAIAFVKVGTTATAYVGTDGGIWGTSNAEATPVPWNNMNNSTLTLTQFYPSVSMNVSSPQIAYGGTQDNGSQKFIGPASATSWTDNNLCGDGGSTAVDDVIPSTVYVACGTGALVNVSYQNGELFPVNTFIPATSGINLADSANFIVPIATDPSTAGVAYLGTTKIYQTVNGANTWTALTGDLVAGGNTEDNFISIAVAPTNPAVVYAGSFGGEVFVATNVAAGTGTFNAVTGQSLLPTRAVTDIAVDPADNTGKTAYVAMSGFSFVTTGTNPINDPKGHIFKTTDGGATWTDVSCTAADCQNPAATDLPNTPVNSIVIDPDIPGTLYAATDVGVYQGTCTTAAPFSCTWATLSTGLPRVAVLSLRLHEPSRTLMAATHGRGVWTIALNNFTATGPHVGSLSPVAATAGSSTSFTLTINGSGLTGATAVQFGSTQLTPLAGGTDSTVTVTVPANQGAGVVKVSVTAGTSSNSLPFAVMGGAPTITNSAPASVNVSTTTATTLTVTGTNFNSNSQVIMDPDVGGTATLQTTFVSSTQLTASLPVSFINGFGSTNSVGVRNPPPGGGTTVTTATIILPTLVVVAPAPINDNFANAIAITPSASGTFNDTRDSSGATVQSTDPIPPAQCVQQTVPSIINGGFNTIWYKFTPTSNGTITDVDTIGSSYDTVLSIWTGSQSSLTPVACNDDIIPGIDIQSQIQNLAVTAGTTYYIMVSSFGPPDPNPIALGGKSILNFTFSGSGTTSNFTIAGSATSVSTTAGSGTSSQTSTITITPAAGFSGVVSVTCGTSVPGVSCGQLSIPAGSTTGTLTINVNNPSSSTSAIAVPGKKNLRAMIAPQNLGGGRGWWMLSAASGLAMLILLVLPGRKRYRAAFSLGLICAVSFVIGCGGGGYGGGGGGLTPTTTHITVSSTKPAANGSITVSATVTGGNPTGMVQFIVDGAALGNPVSISAASAGITVTAANAPSFLPIVGTHTVSATYQGDSTTAASSSGTLNVTVTGTTNLPITGTSGASVANANVSLTIN